MLKSLVSYILLLGYLIYSSIFLLCWSYFLYLWLSNEIIIFIGNKDIREYSNLLCYILVNIPIGITIASFFRKNLRLKKISLIMQGAILSFLFSFVMHRLDYNDMYILGDLSIIFVTNPSIKENYFEVLLELAINQSVYGDNIRFKEYVLDYIENNMLYVEMIIKLNMDEIPLYVNKLLHMLEEGFKEKERSEFWSGILSSSLILLVFGGKIVIKCAGLF